MHIKYHCVYIVQRSFFVLPFIILLALVFNWVLMRGLPEELTTELMLKATTVLSLPVIFCALLFGKGFHLLKSHFLWLQNIRFRHSLLHACLILVALSVAIFCMPVIYLIGLPWFCLLAPLLFGIIGLLGVTAQSVVMSFFWLGLPFFMLIGFQHPATWQATIMLAICSASYLIFTAYFPNKISTKTKNKATNNRRRQLDNTWCNTQVAKFIGHFCHFKTATLTHAMVYPQTKYGFLAIYFAILSGILFWLTQGSPAAPYLILLFIFSCQFPINHETSLHKSQLRPIAHTFVSSQALIRALLVTTDLLALRNIMIFSVLFYGLVNAFIEHPIPLFYALAIWSFVLMYHSIHPLLLIANFKKITLSNSLIAVAIIAWQVLILTLLSLYLPAINVYVYLFASLFLALGVRFITQRFIEKQPLERVLT